MEAEAPGVLLRARHRSQRLPLWATVTYSHSPKIGGKPPPEMNSLGDKIWPESTCGHLRGPFA